MQDLCAIALMGSFSKRNPINLIRLLRICVYFRVRMLTFAICLQIWLAVGGDYLLLFFYALLRMSLMYICLFNG